MRSKIMILFVMILFTNCENAIKNEAAQVDIEAGTEISEVGQTTQQEESIDNETTAENKLLGFWVGYFKRVNYDDGADIYADNYYWTRENKINISIDKIEDGQVIGHSVVAGNDRPFEGTIKETDDKVFEFKVAEPGDDKYDGAFSFVIAENKLSGTWKAYKKIEIQEREYTLEKKTFKYNPDIMLAPKKEFVDWNKSKQEKDTYEMDEGQFETWITNTYSTATDKIFEINASNRILKKSEVENLKKGDLIIIRNAIYARHGYSFKNRPLRVFFDAQDWYIPVYADIKSDFTEIEKENIKLLLKYEKNAAEYYDYFGRG